MMKSMVSPAQGEVMALIMESLQDEVWLSTGRPAECWKVLNDFDTLDALLSIVLVSGLPDEPELVELLGDMVDFGFNGLMVRVRQNDEDAIEYLKDLEQNIMAAADAGALQPEGLAMIQKRLGEYRRLLSEEFIHCIQSLETEQAARDREDEEEIISSPEQMQEFLSEMVVGCPSEFEFQDALQSQLGLIPAEGLGVVAQMLLTSDEVMLKDVVPLMLLNQDVVSANQVARVLAEYPQSVTGKSLSRMIRIRNWLSPETRTWVDRAIQKAKKKGVVMEQASPCQLIKLLACPLDGSGAQGVMALFKNGRDFHLGGFVLKENVGIVDAFCSPPASRKDLEGNMKMAAEQVFSKTVDAQWLEQQLPHFLALSMESGHLAEPAVIQVMEWLGIEQWNPEKLCFRQALLPLLTMDTADQAVINKTLKNSARLADRNFMGSWFEYGSEFNKALENLPLESPRKAQRLLCQQYFEQYRERWFERMVRLALWATYTGKQNTVLAHDCAVIAHLINTGSALEDIPLLFKLAGYSIDQCFEPL
ncbi:hypothetical protein [Endozoicomonas sp. Mp262]|uniref:hypothetical protein n=1 Tax=Endozoicomonas sp. Mp262 TaxID=2919499 RepID=UPI0021D82131